jgi:hypothetical protein
MRLVLANRGLNGFGGSETYLITAGDYLQRLGHEVTLLGLEAGPAAELAQSRGLEVRTRAEDLPAEADATIAQDGEVAHALAERYPGAVRLFVVHSIYFEMQSPPQLPGVADIAVTLNERTRSHCQAMAYGGEVVRLRQPVDTMRFGLAARTGDRARRVVALSNNLGGLRAAMLAQACSDLGLEFELIGRNGRVTGQPEHEIGTADVVVGVGRSVLEAMAAGKAAYVYDGDGGDGWVRPETYAMLEADGFAGIATDAVIDLPRLRRDLADFDPAMGEANRDLARRHHGAGPHAVELVELIEKSAPSSSPAPEVLAEITRMWRVQRRVEEWGIQTSRQNRHLQTQIDSITAGGSYRLARAIGRPAAWLRRLRRR